MNGTDLATPAPLPTMKIHLTFETGRSIGIDVDCGGGAPLSLTEIALLLANALVSLLTMGVKSGRIIVPGGNASSGG